MYISKQKRKISHDLSNNFNNFEKLGNAMIIINDAWYFIFRYVFGSSACKDVCWLIIFVFSLTKFWLSFPFNTGNLKLF